MLRAKAKCFCVNNEQLNIVKNTAMGCQRSQQLIKLAANITVSTMTNDNNKET